jgi:hypothetical protein
MKSFQPTTGTLIRIGGRAALLIALAAGALSMRAQDVVASRPAEDLVPAALQQAQAEQNIVPSGARPAYAPDTPLVASGPFTVRAHFSYRLLYGDGVPNPNGVQQSTTIHNLSPELLVDLGTHWMFDYVPTWVYYSNASYTDSVDQSVRLNGWTTYQDWVLQLTQNYNTTSSPTVETGQQTKQVNWANSLSATYSVNSAVALEFGLLHSYQSAESFTSSHQWSTMDWVHYKPIPHVDTAVGLGLGYVDVNAGADTTFIRPELQAGWSVTNKVSLTAHGGVEDRHFLSGGTPNSSNPIYGASVVLQPFVTTKITLGAEHDVATSLFENVITKSTVWQARLEQRLFGEFYLSTGGSHGKVAFLPLTGGALTSARDDNTYTFDLSLSATVFRRCSAAVVFHNTHNSSTAGGFALSSKQYGLELSYRY